MSELKAIRSGEIYNIIEYEDCYRTDDLYYPKSEADKVIAEKDAEIFNLKEELSYIKADSTFDRDKHKTEVKELLCLIRDKENNFNRAFDSEEKEIRHHKYKRCLAMAKWCRTSSRCDECLGAFKYRDWYWKWFKRWLAIAEKFKPNKEAK